MTSENRVAPYAIPRILAAALLFPFLVVNPRNMLAVEFTSPVDYTAGTRPVTVAVGDFNGDKKLDLAVANAGDGSTANPGSVSILLGKGDGTFKAAVEYAAGQTPNSIAVGDFNGDGKLDLAVANQGSTSAGIDGSVSVLLGKGDGTFQPAVDFTAGQTPQLVVVGDFNGDGKLDLAVTNFGNSSAGISGSVSVLLGVGDGTFLPAVDYDAGPSPTLVVLGDFNLDGNQDLVVSDSASTDLTSSILLGNGDGTFQSPVAFSPGGRSGSFVVADFNGDGKPDLVAAGSGSVKILMGNGDGTFQPAVTAASLSLLVRTDVVADFNGDGKLDLAGWTKALGFCFFNCGSNTGPRVGSMFILLGRGDGTFVQALGPFASGLIPITSADFNGDNLPDLAAVGENFDKVSVLLNTSPTTGADLGVRNAGSRSPVAVGHKLTYTIPVVNEGPKDATNLTLTDTLPGELTLVSKTPSQGSCQGTSSISCDLGSLASAGSATVTIEVTVNAPGTNNMISNTASVSATESDSRPANNTATATTNVKDFDLILPGDPLTVTAGSSVSTPISLSPNDGFNQTATLTCAGAPREATCSISPASVTLDGANPATATLTVKTTAHSFAQVLPWAKPSVMGKQWILAWMALLVGLAVLITLEARRSTARPRHGLVLAATFLLVVFWAACGGENTKVERGTPAGTFPLTITATSGSFTQSTPVTLTVN